MFIFATDREFEREQLITEMNSSTTKKITLNTVEENAVEEINFDDI